MIYYILSTTKKTGGSFLLHQLAQELLNNGADVCMTYPLSPDIKHSIYFDINVSIPVDSRKNIIIIPEIFSIHSKRFLNANIYFWWLSVDNFFRFKHDSFFNDFLRKILSLLLSKRLPLTSLRHLNHLSQSYYASSFLLKNHIESNILSDFLDPCFLSSVPDTSYRNNYILYNPSKGLPITKSLISSFPNFNFVPLVNLSSNELFDLMNSSKVYIDFGHHPGKDRMPREAAMCGCCVITGLEGSASNDIDLPIDSIYKLDNKSLTFKSEFASLIVSVFEDFDTHFHNFDSYRSSIRKEPQVFSEQVKRIFLS